MDFTETLMKKQPLYSICIHYFPEVLPHLFCHGIYSIAAALVFTTVLHNFTHGGQKVGAGSKDKVLSQPDGFILSGNTVNSLD